MDQIKVALESTDKVAEAGLRMFAREWPEVNVVPECQNHKADVLVVIVNTLNDASLSRLNRRASIAATPVILIHGEVNDLDPAATVVANIVFASPRASVTPENLRRTIAKISRTPICGDRTVRMLVESESHPSPSGQAKEGFPFILEFTTREKEILRLLADGRHTADVAAELAYSDRTVKSVIYQLMQRLGLRNRVHLVAYALRNKIV